MRINAFILNRKEFDQFSLFLFLQQIYRNSGHVVGKKLACNHVCLFVCLFVFVVAFKHELQTSKQQQQQRKKKEEKEKELEGENRFADRRMWPFSTPRIADFSDILSGFADLKSTVDRRLDKKLAPYSGLFTSRSSDYGSGR